MAAQLDNVGFTPTAGGTTDWTYSASIANYQTPIQGNVVSGLTYEFVARDTSGNWEYCRGVCTVTGGVPTFARTTVLYNSAQTGTLTPGQSGAGTKITFAAAPSVFIVAIKESLIATDEASSFTATQKAQIQKNIQVSAPTIQRFISGTAATYTTPANCTWIRIRMAGGGAGGSGSGTSGAGAGGAGTASTWSGGSLSAGGAASNAQSSAPTAGGTATGGNILNINGEQGNSSNNAASASSPAGGNSYFGGAGGGALTQIAGGNAATNSGSGGGGGGIALGTSNGGSSSGAAGGYVEHIITNPAATYTYTVGPGGTGGTAGTSGAAGGTGAAGIIIVEEYYN